MGISNFKHCICFNYNDVSTENSPIISYVVETEYNFYTGLCKFLNQKFSGCTHWEGNIVLKKVPPKENSSEKGKLSFDAL